MQQPWGGGTGSSLVHMPIRSSCTTTPGMEANPIFVGSAPSTPQRFRPLGNQGSTLCPQTARSPLPAQATPQGRCSRFHPRQLHSPPQHLQMPSPSLPIVSPPAPAPEGFRVVHTSTRASTSHSVAYTQIVHTNLVPVSPVPPAPVIPTMHTGHGGPMTPLGSTSATSSSNPCTIQNNGQLHSPSSSRSSGHRSKAKFRDEFDRHPWPREGLDAAGLEALDKLLNQPVDIPPCHA